MTSPRTPPSSGPAAGPRSDERRAGRGVAALMVAAVFVVAACGRGDQPLTSTGTAPGGPPGTDAYEISAGIVAGPTVAPTTPPPTEAPTTTAPPPPPAPTTTKAPAPTGATGDRRVVLSPDAPAPRPDVNIYNQIGPANVNAGTAGALSRVYVPHEVSGTVSVIDPVSLRVIDSFPTGPESQHVVPSYDMKTLFAVSGQGNRITPIDPTTGQPGPAIAVDNPYNLYFTPDGSEAIVVAEGAQRLDFRDPHTLELHNSVQTSCYGLNHLDYSPDMSYFIATCEFDGTLIKFDMASRRVVARLAIDMAPSGRKPRNGHAQPQDVRLSSDGTVFFVADLQSDGLYMIDGNSFRQVGFIPAGVGTHSLYPGRDGQRMYVINRGTGIVGGPPHGKGSVSVLNPYTRTIEADWPIPGGGSPDMGNLTADGTQLWLGGRYDREVYVFDLVNGGLVARIPVGINPHGLTVWPQPGRFSLGHTGNTR